MSDRKKYLVLLSLIVLRSADAARTRRFYESLGLHFSVEQHEKGVLHYACEMGGLVLEMNQYETITAGQTHPRH